MGRGRKNKRALRLSQLAAAGTTADNAELLSAQLTSLTSRVSTSSFILFDPPNVSFTLNTIHGCGCRRDKAGVSFLRASRSSLCGCCSLASYHQPFCDDLILRSRAVSLNKYVVTRNRSLRARTGPSDRFFSLRSYRAQLSKFVLLFPRGQHVYVSRAAGSVARV